MKLIKENSYDIVRLLINQIGIAIFSLVLYTALDVFDDEAVADSVRVGLSVFATAFYLVLIYTAAWEYGAKDRIRIDSGKYSPVRAKGALMSVVANLPNFLFAMLAVAFIALHMITGGEEFMTAHAIFNFLIRFIASMYLGIVQGVFSFIPSGTDLSYLLESVGFLVAPILSIGATQLGYSLGFREIKLFGSLKGNKGGRA